MRRETEEYQFAPQIGVGTTLQLHSLSLSLSKVCTCTDSVLWELGLLPSCSLFSLQSPPFYKAWSPWSALQPRSDEVEIGKTHRGTHLFKRVEEDAQARGTSLAAGLLRPNFVSVDVTICHLFKMRLSVISQVTSPAMCPANLPSAPARFLLRPCNATSRSWRSRVASWKELRRMRVAQQTWKLGVRCNPPAPSLALHAPAAPPQLLPPPEPIVPVRSPPCCCPTPSSGAQALTPAELHEVFQAIFGQGLRLFGWVKTHLVMT